MRRGDSFRGRTALAVSLAAGFFSLVPVAAEAGFTKTQTIDTGGNGGNGGGGGSAASASTSSGARAERPS